jgi:hypothetical protein
MPFHKKEFLSSARWQPDILVILGEQRMRPDRTAGSATASPRLQCVIPASRLQQEINLRRKLIWPASNPVSCQRCSGRAGTV